MAQIREKDRRVAAENEIHLKRAKEAEHKFEAVTAAKERMHAEVKAQREVYNKELEILKNSDQFITTSLSEIRNDSENLLIELYEYKTRYDELVAKMEAYAKQIRIVNEKKAILDQKHQTLKNAKQEVDYKNEKLTKENYQLEASLIDANIQLEKQLSSNRLLSEENTIFTQRLSSTLKSLQGHITKLSPDETSMPIPQPSLSKLTQSLDNNPESSPQASANPSLLYSLTKSNQSLRARLSSLQDSYNYVSAEKAIIEQRLANLKGAQESRVGARERDQGGWERYKGLCQEVRESLERVITQGETEIKRGRGEEGEEEREKLKEEREGLKREIERLKGELETEREERRGQGEGEEVERREEGQGIEQREDMPQEDEERVLFDEEREATPIVIPTRNKKKKNPCFCLECGMLIVEPKRSHKCAACGVLYHKKCMKAITQFHGEFKCVGCNNN